MLAGGFGYRVQWKTEGQTWDQSTTASQFEDLEHADDLSNSYTITGLVNGSTYDVRVAAYNDNGVSAWITGSATPDSGTPMENGDISVAQWSKWTSQGYWITYENAVGCIPLYPGLTTEQMVYRCPEVTDTDEDDSTDTDEDDSTDADEDSGTPMENGDISVAQWSKWTSQGYWITYENAVGCIPLYPGLTTEQMVYRCPE